MHIAFILAGLGAGGAEKVVSLLGGELVRRGHRVSVISFDRPGDPVYHPLDPAITVHRLGVARGHGSLARGVTASVRRLLALRRLYKTLGADVVASFLTKINVLSVLASAGLEQKVIISERNNPLEQKAHPLWMRTWNHAARRASAVVLQSEAIRAIYPPEIQRLAVVIPNPVELPALPDRQDDTRIVAGVGRLTRQKGFDLLIDAFGLVAAEFPEWRLVIWGEGPLRAELERQAAATGLSERISLPGNSDKPAGWVETTEIYALTSRFEGFPNVLLEAMRAGLPSAAFRCDYGPEEIVTNGENGLLVGKQDVAGMAQALRTLMSDSALRERLARAALARSETYSLPRIADQWEAIFEQVGGRP